MHKIGRYALVATGFVLAFAISAATAQERANVRGTIEKVDGQTLTIASREGPTVTIKLADNATPRAVVGMPLSDVKQGSYVGISAMPQPDGSQRAIAITVFPESVRPTEGQRPHDLQPGSTMTNAAVETTAASVDGQVLTVKYKQGDKVSEQKFVVPTNTEIVTYAPAEKSELRPGAKIVIFNAVKQSDGTWQAASINIGRDGKMPPM
jgi:hypothetical protein